jgi:hypothetical protein
VQAAKGKMNFIYVIYTQPVNEKGEPTDGTSDAIVKEVFNELYNLSSTINQRGYVMSTRQPEFIFNFDPSAQKANPSYIGSEATYKSSPIYNTVGSKGMETDQYELYQALQKLGRLAYAPVVIVIRRDIHASYTPIDSPSALSTRVREILKPVIGEK